MKKEDLKYMSQYMKVTVGRNMATIMSLPYRQYPNRENEKVSSVRVVFDDDISRYYLLKSWERNPDNHRLTKAERAEMESYEKTVSVEDMEPADRIRFIGSDYSPRFSVTNLGRISINGEEYMVVYIDSTHFYTVNKSGKAQAYHICEFAESVERHNAIVERIEVGA